MFCLGDQTVDSNSSCGLTSGLYANSLVLIEANLIFLYNIDKVTI